jgi:hypothetical protein
MESESEQIPRNLSGGFVLGMVHTIPKKFIQIFICCGIYKL